MAAKKAGGVIMIRVEQLGFEVSGKPLLADVTFDLKSGEVLAVLGPNGAGKSTLLKCLAGQQCPSTGRITVANSDLFQMPARSVAKWRGVLPQSSRIPFEFTVIEIVMLGRSPHLKGGETFADQQIAREALQLTDALHLADRTVNTLSGGELQRAHMARVLAQIWSPVPVPGRLLLLDEPTASLDLNHQHMLLQIARSWAANGTAVLVILHDLNLAATYADRLMILKQGRVVSTGAPTEILTRECIRDVFEVDATVIEHPNTRTPVVLVNASLERSCPE